MRLHRKTMSLFIAMSFVFGASTLGTVASAGIIPIGWDNPDLLDIERWFSSDDVYSGAFVRQTGVTNSAAGSGYAATNSGYFSNYSNGSLVLSWDLFAPDKVTRSDRKGDLSQKTYVRLQVSVYTTYYSSTSWTTAFPEKCKASTNVKADKSGDFTQANWSVNCKVEPGDFPSMSDEMAERLEEIFGKKIINAKSGKVKVKGKAKDTLVEKR